MRYHKVCARCGINKHFNDFSIVNCGEFYRKSRRCKDCVTRIHNKKIAPPTKRAIKRRSKELSLIPNPFIPRQRHEDFKTYFLDSESI